jgi:hypothetical protein
MGGSFASSDSHVIQFEEPPQGGSSFALRQFAGSIPYLRKSKLGLMAA